MAAFKAFFILESKRFINKKNLAIFMLLLLLSLFLVQIHINRYKALINYNQEFKEIETLKINQFLNYTQYGLYGFRVIFNPSPLSIFFSYSGAFSGVTSFIDAGEKMNFYNPVKAKTLFERNPTGFMDFAGIILLLGSLFALYSGYESIRHREYQKFIVTLADYHKAFFSIALSRAFFTIIFFLLLTSASALLVNINGVEIPKNEWVYLLAYVAVTMMMLFIFFAVGMICGSFKSKVNGIIAMVLIWFILVFFIPWALHAVMLGSQESIHPDSQMELEKLKLLMNFEKKALREVGVFKSGKEAPENVKKLAESYWQNEFKILREMDEKVKTELKTGILRFETISLFLPTTFYLSVTNAVSSKGYGSFVDFYSYVQALKVAFLRFYLDRKFYTGQTGVESFVKGNENIYFSRGKLPAYFGLGIIFMLVYVVGGFTAAYYRLKRTLFIPAGKEAEGTRDLNGLDMELKKGQTYVLLTTGNVVTDQLYNFFSGKRKELKGVVRLDDERIETVSHGTFTFLCHPGDVPGDMTVGDFLNFTKRVLKISNKTMAELYIRLAVDHIEGKTFNELTQVEKGRVLLAVARLKKSSIYMFRDFLKGMPGEFVTHFTHELQDLKTQEGGAAILYLTDDVLLVSKIGDSGGSFRIDNAPKLEAYKLV